MVTNVFLVCYGLESRDLQPPWACHILEWDFSTLWRLCIESPSQPKLASSLHNKRLSYWRLTGFGRNDGRWSDIGVIHAFLHSSFFYDFFDANLLFTQASSRAGVRVGMVTNVFLVCYGLESRDLRPQWCVYHWEIRFPRSAPTVERALLSQDVRWQEGKMQRSSAVFCRRWRETFMKQQKLICNSW